MITTIVTVSTAGGAALLLARIATTIAHSDQATTFVTEGVDIRPEPADPVDDAFETVRAVLFDQITPVVAGIVVGRHRPGNIQAVPADYLIPNAYAAQIAPRLLPAVTA